MFYHRAVAVIAGCMFAAGSGIAHASISTTDPGLYAGIDDRFEARMRLDGGGPIGLPDLVSGSGQVFVNGPDYFLTSPGSTISITGDLSFAWDDGVNLQGERFKLSFKVTEGTLIPAPGVAGMGVLGGLLVSRRRRG